ncbi:MAG: hypothetical protein LC541_14890 [Candidatus Thiodiazotropha sp.]|nr:hypothetical protein [Candidatus Thiodiazotropha sp.]MCM8884556.1 hypothetical protein [Candidatus Thiodiazotropha sp.]
MSLQYTEFSVVTLNKLNKENNRAADPKGKRKALLAPKENDVQINCLCFQAKTDTEPGVISLYLSGRDEVGCLIEQIPINKHKRTRGTGVWGTTLNHHSSPLFPMKIGKGFTLSATISSTRLESAFDVTLLGGTFTGRMTPLYQDRYLFERCVLGKNRITNLNVISGPSTVYMPMWGKGMAKTYRIDKIQLHVPGTEWPDPSLGKEASGRKEQDNTAKVTLTIGRMFSSGFLDNELMAINIKNHIDGRLGAHGYIDHTIRPDLFPLFLPKDHYIGIRSKMTNTLKQIHVHFSGGWIDD